MCGTTLDGQAWPSISIITPSYNQGQFLEETIRSVLLQGYPNLEYIIIDGGSTDNSVEIIGKYEPWLAYWVSEPDKGQSHAINKGWRRATGDLLGWVNSDDLLLPGSLAYLAQAHCRHPSKILAASVIDFDDEGNRGVTDQRGFTFSNAVQFWQWKYKYHMPGIFYPRHLIEEVGQLDEKLRYLFDMDLMIRLLRIAEPLYLQRPVARFRLHATSKTVSEKGNFPEEAMEISRRYWHLLEDVDVRGFNRWRSQVTARRGLRRIRQGDIVDGVSLIRRSVRLSPAGLPRHILKPYVQLLRRLFAAFRRSPAHGD